MNGIYVLSSLVFALLGGVDPAMYNYVSPGHTGDVYQLTQDAQQHPQQQVPMGLPINPNNPYQYYSHVSAAVFNICFFLLLVFLLLSLVSGGNKRSYVLKQTRS